MFWWIEKRKGKNKKDEDFLLQLKCVYNYQEKEFYNE